MRLIDLTGQTFGRNLVLGRAGTAVQPSGHKRATWLCRCECGTEFVARGLDLRSGNTKSCGCLQRDVVSGWVGEANPAWKGDGIEYDAAHMRVKALRGPASGHSCCDCGRPAGEWSYIGGSDREQVSRQNGHPYSPAPDDYVARCVPCHRKYDYGQEAA